MATGFFWYDVMTTDAKAGIKFYTDVVGSWGAEDGPGGNGNGYTVFTVEGQGVAGLMKLPEDAAKMGVPPCWMGYIAVDDVDAAAARLEKLGGKIHKPPQDIPGVIRFAVVADPQGAGFIIAKGLMDKPMGVYQMFKTGGEFAMGGIMTKPPAVPVPHWGFYINVPAIDAAVERVTTGGGKVINGPMEVPGGQWIIQGIDPQGAFFNFVAPKR